MGAFYTMYDGSYPASGSKPGGRMGFARAIGSRSIVIWKKIQIWVSKLLNLYNKFKNNFIINLNFVKLKVDKNKLTF